jgi:hypothetical protein
MHVNNTPKTKIVFKFDTDTEIEVDTDKAYDLLDQLIGRSTKPSLHQENKLTLEIPNRSELEEFIKNQQNYQFSIESVAQNFIGDELSNVDKPKLNRYFSAIRTKVNRIRQTIEDSENGKWESYYDGRSKIFKFVKDSGDEAELSMQEHERREQPTTENH